MLLLFPWLSPCQAQVAEPAPEKTISIKFSPQHLLINGLHLYIERIPKQGSRHGLVLSPRFYSGKTNTVDILAGRGWEDEHAKVFGYGAEVQHRIYINNSASLHHRKVYLAYGVNYHHYNVEFERNGWLQEKDQEGLEVYKYRLRPFNEKINQLGGVAMLGLQTSSLDGHLLFDFYSGAGIKNSSVDTNYLYTRYERNAMDFGYSGLYFIGGFALGVAF